MKNLTSLMTAFVFGFSVFLTAASAEIGSGQPVTPSERLRMNEAKVREFPDLRGRRTPKSRQPASEGAFLVDNLSQKVLSEFRADPAIAELPMRLKVSSKNGVVTLEGAAKNRDDIRLVESRARRIEGVKEVQSRIELAGSTRELLGS
ncbi:MAG TPA: BON domain-containing protein [Candidatus Eisenbacteria bacterium]|jgi:hypothetical protein|nr:BON domain-containing protein [Candidatus Eisenbacteria bacterium]